MAAKYNIRQPQLKYSTIIYIKPPLVRRKISHYMNPKRNSLSMEQLQAKGLATPNPPPAPKLRPKYADLSKIETLALQDADEKLLKEINTPKKAKRPIEIIDLTVSPIKKTRMSFQSPEPVVTIDLTKSPDPVFQVGQDLHQSPNSVVEHIFFNIDALGDTEVEDILANAN
jgi:hypothetical protein